MHAHVITHSPTSVFIIFFGNFGIISQCIIIIVRDRKEILVLKGRAWLVRYHKDSVKAKDYESS